MARRHIIPNDECDRPRVFARAIEHLNHDCRCTVIRTVYDSLLITFSYPSAVSETDEKAEEEYGAHVDYFYQKNLHVYEGFAEAPGYRTIKTLRTGVAQQQGAAASRQRKNLTWKDYIEQGYVIAGSPKTVIKKLREAVEGLRVGHLMTLLQIGSMPRDLTMKNTELFAREVLPHIQDMWDEYEDHWWPQPLEDRAVAVAAGSNHA